MTKNAVLGQYRGYLGEEGVEARSTTATYVAVRLYVDSWRWQGVPFYLRTGKAMKDKLTEIVIQFKRPPDVMFAADLNPNVLSLCLQPDEGIHLKFEVKVPDKAMSMQPKDMEFHYGSAFESQAIPEAYERLLQDALEGDASLFIRSDHIEEAWSMVGPLLLGGDGLTPRIYEPQSWGPEAANDLLSGDGHSWQRVCGVHSGADT